MTKKEDSAPAFFSDQETETLHSAMMKISEAMRTTDTLNDFFAALHCIVNELMTVENFSVALIEKEDNGKEYLHFHYIKDKSNSRRTKRIVLNRSLIGYVIRTGEALLLDRQGFEQLRREEEIDPSSSFGFSSWLSIPLKVKGKVIGAVTLKNSSPDLTFREREKKLLLLISDQISLAIELGQYREHMQDLVRKRIRELEEEKKVQAILYDISQGIYQSRNLREFLALVHCKVGELMDARNFYIALYDQDMQRYKFPYVADDYDQFDNIQGEDLKDSLTDYVRLRGALLADRWVHQRLIDQNLVGGIVGTDSEVWLGVPLLVPGKKEAIGVMVVQSYEDNCRLGEKEKRILVGISTTIALAIDRILLVTDIIHHFNNAITSIKGNAEIVHLSKERLLQLAQILRIDLKKAITDEGECPSIIKNIEHILELISEENEKQDIRIGKIIQGIDKASDRINQVLSPLLLIGDSHFS